MNILAFGAHPDDVEFLCAGTLLKYHKQGHQIFIALTTSGNTGSNEIPSKEETAAIREAEQLEAAKDAAHSLGISESIDPFMTLSFMSLPVIPTLRLTTRGVVDVLTQQYI